MATKKKMRKVTLREVELARGAYLSLKYTYEAQHPPKDIGTPEERDARYAKAAVEHEAERAAAGETVTKTLYEPLPASAPGFLPEPVKAHIQLANDKYRWAYGPWPLSWRLRAVWYSVKNVWFSVKKVYHA